ncbi:CpsD/CapB family tyrosine-protein kinase [Desertibacillus haloalkaliphilus]|uniref:CpsD/CapB family tyrosine-protein kinase n=1 Tax=Desertibacillus haloalkaliphilus TaxID=1328930 RepID=UPI001C258441|nr:CpsD/CapB family tyrosine-protein kinase [Desertibacillus haloalkaliphilus]MBU8906563.1 CpsD/CapB family tyrosine-protein kinase [Desertibacillus haloalkaliphilus]
MGRKESRQQNRSLVTYNDSKSPIAEQYRTIRTNIQYASVDREIRTIMVTSAGPGEGKSTTVANLAVVMAQQGKKVLLVDSDLRKPTVHYTFRKSNDQGLTNVLTHQARLDAVISPSDVLGLDILTSGPVPPNPAELLSAKSMESFISDALADYDIVLFDSPPVLAVTDAQILSNLCDGVVLVLSSGKTEQDGAKKAKELLDNANAKILGAVLNAKELKQSQYYYYYGSS